MKLVKTGRISELKSENEAKILYAPRLKTQCVAPLWDYFWGTSRSPKWAHDSPLESPGCLLSKPSKRFGCGCHFPLQNFNLPRLVPAGAKGGRKAIFGVFSTLKTIHNLMKSLSHSWACIMANISLSYIGYNRSWGRSFLLSKAIGWPPCIKTAPIPSPDASHPKQEAT